MVLVRESRDELALALRQLVTGRMTNDDFDKGCAMWCDCPDPAVSEIAMFGWGLYSSDTLFAYKLRGRNAVSRGTREFASRAILFLQTDAQYEWPTNVRGIEPYWGGWGAGGNLLLVGLPMLVLALVSKGAAAVFAAICGFLGALPTLHWLTTYREKKAELLAFYASGDFAVWPFKNRDAMNQAKESPRFFAGSGDQQQP